MKQLFTYLLFLLVFYSFANAQTEINIFKSNNAIEKHQIKDIDSITFKTFESKHFISNVTPLKGAYGDTVLVTGKGFGKSFSDYVMINQLKATQYVFWNDTSIKFIIPDGASSGLLFVYVNNIPSNGIQFEIVVTTTLKLISLEPNSAKIGETITLRGTGFGNSRNNYVLFNSSRATDYELWNDTLIKVKVPEKTTSGLVKVYRDDEELSNGIEFTILTTSIGPTSLSGRVTDESGNGLMAVYVICDTNTTLTDNDGVFLFDDIKFSSNRIFVKCQKKGYYETYKTSTVNSSGSNEIRIVMLKPDTTFNFSAYMGGTLNYNSNVSVKIKPRSFKNEDNSIYTGYVNMLAKFKLATDNNYNDVFPGDLIAKCSDGDIDFLESYAFYVIELKDTNNKKLELKDSAAILTFPKIDLIDDTLKEIPLWFFNPEIGMWQEEGKAVKVGSKFIGDVKHFTPWNFDRPISPPIIQPPPPITVKGRVLSCNDNERLAGVKVNIGQQQVTTDNFGNFITTYPPYRSFDVKVAPPLISNVFKVTAQNPGSTVDNITLILENMSIIKGNIIGCSDTLVSAIVKAKWDTNGFSSTFAKDGRFSIWVPSKTNIRLEIGDTTIMIEPLEVCVIKKIGTIKSCDTLAEEYGMVKIGDQVWMKKNLNVSCYRNGDTIRHALTYQDWLDACNKGEGAWGYYENDTTKGKVLGKLYNWFVGIDPRGIGPKGWRMPSDDDWLELEKAIGMKPIIAEQFGFRGIDEGNKLKSKGPLGILYSWSQLTTEPGTDTYGFNALPAGEIGMNPNQLSEGLGFHSYFWTKGPSTVQSFLTIASMRCLAYNFGGIQRDSRYVLYGMSIRLLAD